MIHELKILPKYFADVISGNKTFEIRKFDRPFHKAVLVCKKATSKRKMEQESRQ